MANQEKCEGIKGGNVCGRHPELLITNIVNDEFFYSCMDCAGRIIMENDIDEGTTDRLYE